MIASSPTLEQSGEKTRSAEETVNFLNENFGPDECDRLALIASLIVKAVYEKQPGPARQHSGAERKGRRTRRRAIAPVNCQEKWG